MLQWKADVTDAEVVDYPTTQETKKPLARKRAKGQSDWKYKGEGELHVPAT